MRLEVISWFSCGFGSNSGPGVRTRRNSLESNQRVLSRYHLLVLLCLWKVLGSSRVVSSMRALSIGDKVSWTKYCGLSQHDLHSIDSTMLSRVSLPSSIWDFLVICCLGCLHGQLHLRSPARNKASLNRGVDLNSSLDIALVKNNALAGDKIAVALLRSRNILIEQVSATVPVPF
ncbi:hypothetical protein NC652_023005 [Populus alba x Populus x berolinensis]|nr:hypothetical protein NC652_023005 [Populus alba x Populus x berolinensis]